jgi:hypothetical protein
MASPDVNSVILFPKPLVIPIVYYGSTFIFHSQESPRVTIPNDSDVKTVREPMNVI